MRLLILILLAGVAAWFAPAPLSRAHGSIEIAAPRERVWGILSDLTSARLWDPALKDVRLVGDTQVGPGATRESPGAVVTTRETVREWVAFNRLEFEVNLQPELSRFERSTFELSPAGSGTRVDWSIDYQMNGGYLGYFGDRFLLGSVHQGRISEGLAHLKRYAETGEPAF